MEKRKYIRYVTKEKLDNVCEANKLHIKKYFNYKNMKLSDTTKKNYESDFNQWLVFINEKYNSGEIPEENILLLLKDEDGMEYMVDLIEDYVAFCVTVLGNNERRIQRRLSSISSFFNFLLKKRKIKVNPLEYIERPSLKAGEKPQIVQTFLTEEQIKEIRKGLKKLGNLQLELYFELSISTMARVNAINNIKIEQIYLEENIIKKVKEKEGYVVDLLFSDKVKELIKKWLKYREENGIECEYLFVTKKEKREDGTWIWGQAGKTTMQSYWVKKIGKIIGVETLHAHDFRHSMSSILYNKGMPLEVVQDLLHHQSPETTLKHYIKKDTKKLQDIKKKFEI